MTAIGAQRTETRHGRRWRILAGVSLTGAIGALVATIAVGALSTTGSGTGSATTGSVTLLALGAPATVTCHISNMVPGDSSSGWTGAQGNHHDTECKFSVQYTGTLSAYIGMTETTSTSGNKPALYDGTPNGLQFQIVDQAGKSYTTNGKLNGGTAISPLFVGTDPGTPNGQGQTNTFSVDYDLPSLAGVDTNLSPVSNAYQGGSTTLLLTLYAVQSAANGSAAKCQPGQPCPNIVWS